MRIRLIVSPTHAANEIHEIHETKCRMQLWNQGKHDTACDSELIAGWHDNRALLRLLRVHFFATDLAITGADPLQ